ncbi:Short chain dehydrogenase [Enterovibrio norvegicus]|uniref:SDR family oxidoreductase n=1 Tax=Enterovibrio norvegicus TaxID=188144 RepID=A0ABV4L856_9GAMM|nr:SDR family oxidoreductase [Enterovibrio norvegicus]MCC4800314.1 SDR family oxidoreductase [Enterovibrio norvegicus]OEE44550.1 Short chain dehydrogenase [Enterovibrio norvegicus]OEF56575.1 Short chain dehydrogenase [Enterovibrio norvegicus]OEF64207.1 Short chain dehydrogenase [Enterovibrio norvegicus]PMH72231.1 Short chain dehydrogenase [Enterovibrio norvegicus]
MQTLFITGGNRGIGLELVKQSLKNKDAILATYRGDTPPELPLTQDEKNRLTWLRLDVTNATDLARLPDVLANQHIDILINNAGVIGPDRQSYNDMDTQGWLHTFEVNTIAPLMVTNALLKNLSLSSSPRVVTVSSQMGALHRESTGMIAYRSSKAAINKVMQVLSLELKAQKIVVCPVHPGWVQTDMGGSEADITAEQSASGILLLAHRLTMQDSGKFFTWEGKEHVW